MNGGSLSALRDVGWVEFGFQQAFFESMLHNLGFDTKRHVLQGYNHCDVWIAQRRLGIGG